MFSSLIFRRAFVLLFGALVVSPTIASPNTSNPICQSSLSGGIPSRSFDAMDASRFVAKASKLSGEKREALIVDQLAKGNVPDFLRQLQPVTIKGKVNGSKKTITLCVTPDYLAVGSDKDFLRVPMGMKAAKNIANRFGFVLPTEKIVDAIHAQADQHLRPWPMTPGPQMTSTKYYTQHNYLVERQRRIKGAALGSLMAGHKKDLVLTKRLNEKPGRVAIYGWHYPNGKNIQPLSLVHGAEYADYSHGVRLVSTTVYIDGKPRDLYNLLEDTKLASLISKEGAIPNVIKLAGADRLIAPIWLAATAKHQLGAWGNSGV